jgi:hypothetical protein
MIENQESPKLGVQLGNGTQINILDSNNEMTPLDPLDALGANPPKSAKTSRNKLDSHSISSLLTRVREIKKELIEQEAERNKPLASKSTLA